MREPKQNSVQLLKFSLMGQRLCYSGILLVLVQRKRDFIPYFQNHSSCACTQQLLISGSPNQCLGFQHQIVENLLRIRIIPLSLELSDFQLLPSQAWLAMTSCQAEHTTSRVCPSLSQVSFQGRLVAFYLFVCFPPNRNHFPSMKQVLI